LPTTRYSDQGGKKLERSMGDLWAMQKLTDSEWILGKSIVNAAARWAVETQVGVGRWRWRWVGWTSQLKGRQEGRSIGGTEMLS
jgi:hypothetical protein